MNKLGRALDEVQLVKTTEVGGLDHILCWYGGTQVLVWVVSEDEWINIDLFSISDGKGRPLSRDQMSVQMEQYICVIEESFDPDGEEL